MAKLPLSILIPTKNSALFLENALLSASFAQEIIILDDNSNDETLAIAKKYQTRIIQRSIKDFSLKRDFLKEKATQPWLFYLDADERISRPLKKEIEEAINLNHRGAYQVNRLNVFWGKIFHYGGWSPSWVIRFFSKDSLVRWQGQLHEQPVYKGRLFSFRSPLIHLSHNNLRKSLENTLSWSWLEAQLFYEAHHKPVKWYHFVSAPLREIFFRLIKKGGYKDGLEGFLESIMQGISKFITYERLWELQNGKLKEKYSRLDKILKQNKFDSNILLYETKNK